MIISFIKKHRIFLIFSIFFFLLLFQHQFLWLYHDDYGYASLSYAVDIGNVGHNYSLTDIFKFLGLHYMNWGGRISCFFIECLLLKFGLPCYRLFQSLVILFIFYFIYKFVVNRTKIADYKVALLTAAMYGIIEIMVIRDGFFWITGSVNYVFPILTFFALIYIMQKKQKSKLLLFLQIILGFFAAFSHEQTSAMTVTFVMLTLLEEKVLNKKIKKENIVTFVVAIVGFLLLLLCPGSHNRLENTSGFSNLSILGKLSLSIPNLINGVFSVWNGAFITLFLILVMYISIINLKNNGKNSKLVNISSLSNIIIGVISFLRFNSNYFNYLPSLFQNQIYQKGLIILFLIQLAFLIYSFIFYFLKKDMFVLKLFICGIASLSVMLISSYYPSRASIGFIMVIFVVFLTVFCQFFEKIKFTKCTNYFIISICLFSLINYMIITRGYYDNDKINRENDKILTEASIDIKNGKKVEKIKLHKMKDITYSGDQPYIDGFEYISIWIKNYYSLPKDVELIYE